VEWLLVGTDAQHSRKMADNVTKRGEGSLWCSILVVSRSGREFLMLRLSKGEAKHGFKIWRP